jgi:hypothetical protein
MAGVMIATGWTTEELLSFQQGARDFSYLLSAPLPQGLTHLL